MAVQFPAVKARASTRRSAATVNTGWPPGPWQVGWTKLNAMRAVTTKKPKPVTQNQSARSVHFFVLSTSRNPLDFGSSLNRPCVWRSNPPSTEQDVESLKLNRFEKQTSFYFYCKSICRWKASLGGKSWDLWTNPVNHLELFTAGRTYSKWRSCILAWHPESQ